MEIVGGSCAADLGAIVVSNSRVVSYSGTTWIPSRSVFRGRTDSRARLGREDLRRHGHRDDEPDLAARDGLEWWIAGCQRRHHDGQSAAVLGSALPAGCEACICRNRQLWTATGSLRAGVCGAFVRSATGCRVCRAALRPWRRLQSTCQCHSSSAHLLRPTGRTGGRRGAPRLGQGFGVLTGAVGVQGRCCSMDKWASDA